ncbi:MAG: hypothetical protein M1820_007953 [Bogoriella megaspora]|nr:MAG: hypothetical protein M1820_007953 [Bogoriella megaspora]
MAYLGARIFCSPDSKLSTPEFVRGFRVLNQVRSNEAGVRVKVRKDVSRVLFSDRNECDVRIPPVVSGTKQHQNSAPTAYDPNMQMSLPLHIKSGKPAQVAISAPLSIRTKQQAPDNGQVASKVTSCSNSTLHNNDEVEKNIEFSIFPSPEDPIAAIQNNGHQELGIRPRGYAQNEATLRKNATGIVKGATHAIIFPHGRLQIFVDDAEKVHHDRETVTRVMEKNFHGVEEEKKYPHTERFEMSFGKAVQLELTKGATHSTKLPRAGDIVPYSIKHVHHVRSSSTSDINVLVHSRFDGEVVSHTPRINGLDPEELVQKSLIFDNQVKVFRNINHPHIVKMVDCDSRSLTIYYEKIPCEHLAVKRRVPLGYSDFGRFDVLLCMISIASALRYLHVRGISHGKIEPSHIFYCGPAKYTMLGGASHISHEDEAHGVVNIPHCMVKNGADNPIRTLRDDIYALGIVGAAFLNSVRNPKSIPPDRMTVRKNWETGAGMTKYFGHLALTVDEELDEFLYTLQKVQESSQQPGGTPLRNLIGRMIDDNPANRPTANEVYNELFRLIEKEFPEWRELPKLRDFTSGLAEDVWAFRTIVTKREKEQAQREADEALANGWTDEATRELSAMLKAPVDEDVEMKDA